MVTLETAELSPGIRYLRNAYQISPFRDNPSRVSAWQAIESAVRRIHTSDSEQILEELHQSPKIDSRNVLRPGIFQDFVVLVGEQGSGKATMALEFARRRYKQLTMSDIVRKVAPALGFSPDTTQGKIDAGHRMRGLFGMPILMQLCVLDAKEDNEQKVVIDGPRSMFEVRAAKKAGARIIGLITDTDNRGDRAERSRRVVNERSAHGRIMTIEDFRSRENQEHRRIQRMLTIADNVVVTNRKAADLVDLLIPV